MPGLMEPEGRGRPHPARGGPRPRARGVPVVDGVRLALRRQPARRQHRPPAGAPLPLRGRRDASRARAGEPASSLPLGADARDRDRGRDRRHRAISAVTSPAGCSPPAATWWPWGRDAGRLAALGRFLAAAVPGGAFETERADLSLVAASGRAGEAIAARHAGVALLVNNAGIFTTRRQETAEGHERTLATQPPRPLRADPARCAPPSSGTAPPASSNVAR